MWGTHRIHVMETKSEKIEKKSQKVLENPEWWENTNSMCPCTNHQARQRRYRFLTPSPERQRGQAVGAERRSLRRRRFPPCAGRRENLERVGGQKAPLVITLGLGVGGKKAKNDREIKPKTKKRGAKIKKPRKLMKNAHRSDIRRSRAIPTSVGNTEGGLPPHRPSGQVRSSWL